MDESDELFCPECGLEYGSDCQCAGPTMDELTYQSRSDGEYAKPTDWWASESSVQRVVDGVAYRVDRLTAIGNGQVPAVAAVAFKILSSRLSNKNKNK
jgi:DNA (cytosine-5)-methyltransferase 1